MDTWIALIRGINVGGRHIMPMARLRTLLSALGCHDVETYIQSGNVVFRSAVAKDALSRRILDAVEVEFGFRPQLMLLKGSELRKAIDENPFPEAAAAPKSLHFFFLEPAPTTPDLTAIAGLAADTERYLLKDKVFYLHAPDGIGRSKLAAGAERKLQVSATARNYSTVEKLALMATSRASVDDPAGRPNQD